MIFYVNFRSKLLWFVRCGKEIADSKWIIESIKFKARCFPMLILSKKSLWMILENIRAGIVIWPTHINSLLGLVKCYLEEWIRYMWSGNKLSFNCSLSLALGARKYFHFMLKLLWNSGCLKIKFKAFLEYFHQSHFES